MQARPAPFAHSSPSVGRCILGPKHSVGSPRARASERETSRSRSGPHAPTPHPPPTERATPRTWFVSWTTCDPAEAKELWGPTASAVDGREEAPGEGDRPRGSVSEVPLPREAGRVVSEEPRARGQPAGPGRDLGLAVPAGPASCRELAMGGSRPGRPRLGPGSSDRSGELPGGRPGPTPGPASPSQGAGRRADRKVQVRPFRLGLRPRGQSIRAVGTAATVPLSGTAPADGVAPAQVVPARVPAAPTPRRPVGPGRLSPGVARQLRPTTR